MGVLRSCYSTMARFYYDSDVELPIIWYWAASDAVWFSGRSSFSPITFSERSSWGNPGVGESPSASRPWRNGSIPMASPSGELDGDTRWFEIGQMTSDPGLDRTSFGIPVNCAGPPLGAYCHLTVGQGQHFTVQKMTGEPLGTAFPSSGGGEWRMEGLDGNPIGHIRCIEYVVDGTSYYNLEMVTNLVDGVFRPYVVNNPTIYGNPVRFHPLVGVPDTIDVELVLVP